MDFLGLAALAQRLGETELGVGAFGSQLHRLRILVQRLHQQVGVLVERSQVETRLPVAGRQGNGLLDLRRGGLGVSGETKSLPETEMQLGVVRQRLDPVLVDSLRCLRVALGSVQRGKLEVSAGIGQDWLPVPRGSALQPGRSRQPPPGYCPASSMRRQPRRGCRWSLAAPDRVPVSLPPGCPVPGRHR